MVPSSQLHILRTIRGDNDNNNSYHTYYYYYHYYCDDCAGRVAYSMIHLPTAFLRRKTENTRRKPEGPAEEILPSQNIIIIITAKFPKVVVRSIFPRAIVATVEGPRASFLWWFHFFLPL